MIEFIKYLERTAVADLAALVGSLVGQFYIAERHCQHELATEISHKLKLVRAAC